MRVLMMAHAWVPFHCGGAEVMAHTMMRHLVQEGHEVHVLLSVVDAAVPQPFTYEGVHIWPHTGKDAPAKFLYSPNYKPDVMVAHLENVPRCSILAKMWGIPLVHIQHNHIIQTTHQLEFHKPDLTVFNTEWMRDYYVDRFDKVGARLPNYVVVRPPVYSTEYKTTPGDHVTLINLYAEKGPDTFYELARRMPKTKFLGVVGGYGAQVIRKLPNVTIINHVKSAEMKAKVYSKTKILLMPSSYESYGRTAAEAMCSGIPVVAHPTDGLKECVGTGGFFHKRDDYDEWEKTVKYLQQPGNWRKASEYALKRAAELDPAGDLQNWTEAMEVVSGEAARKRK